MTDIEPGGLVGLLLFAFAIGFAVGLVTGAFTPALKYNPKAPDVDLEAEADSEKEHWRKDVAQDVLKMMVEDCGEFTCVDTLTAKVWEITDSFIDKYEKEKNA